MDYIFPLDITHLEFENIDPKLTKNTKNKFTKKTKEQGQKLVNIQFNPINYQFIIKNITKVKYNELL